MTQLDNHHLRAQILARITLAKIAMNRPELGKSG
jgi:hypothetical protein